MGNVRVPVWWMLAAACAVNAAEISGVVRDISGGTVVSAVVLLNPRAPGPPKVARTGLGGDFRFTVEPGQYGLTITADGFAGFTRGVTVRDRPSAPVAVTLQIRALRQELTVNDHPGGLSVDAAENADSPQAGARELAGLPALDGDYLGPLLRFLDPAAIGSGGVSVVVDGHEGPTSRVPLSMVKEVRINNNPYAAQFSAPGRGRVEVITKDPDPGIHGDAAVLLRDYHFNGREAFATRRPEERWRTAQATLTGPLGRGKRDFFMLSGDRGDQDTVGVVYALTPAGILQENAPTPNHRNWATARWNHRHGKDGSFWIGYEHDGAVNRSQNVGGTRLPEAGVDSGHFWNEILYSDQGLLSSRLSHSLRGWLGHVGFWTSSRSNDPAVIVSGAFTGGGAQQSQFTPRTYFVATDILTYVRGKHTVTFGVELQELTRFGAAIRDNFGGTTVYSSLDDYIHNRPLLYSRQFGTGHGVYGIATMGAFVQDEVQLRPGLSVQFGARYYYQNHFNDDANNIAPRFSLAWSPGRSRKVVVRGGMGIFYDRQQPGTVVETELYNGVGIGKLIVSLLDPGPSPNAAGITRLDAAARIPSSLHFSSSVEYLLTKRASLTMTLVGARGLAIFRSNDVNAPLPYFTAGRPDLRYGQIRNIDSGGSMERNAVELTARGSFGKRLNATAQYTLGQTCSDTEGIAFFPATPSNWSAEWGRANSDVRHRLAMLLGADGGRWLQFGAVVTLATGTPVNVTTGGDENHDGISNDRPPGVGRNSMAGPGLAQLDLRWSRRVAAKEHKQRAATLSVDAFNALNHVNYAAYVGVLRSPWFGRPVSARAARRLQLQLRFGF